MVVDALEVAVCLIVYLLTKVLVCLGPHLREVSFNKRGGKLLQHFMHLKITSFVKNANC